MVGNVVSAIPYLSEDRCLIYTEYSISVSEVVSEVIPRISGTSLTLLVVGGTARLPDGRVITHSVTGLGSGLAEGDKYVLLLVYYPQVQAYQLAKAWGIKDGHAVPMAADDIARARLGKSSYANLNEQQFLQVVRSLRASLKPKQ